MSLQEKYQSILELANSNGTTYELSEGDGVLHINGTAPNAEAKQQLHSRTAYPVAEVRDLRLRDGRDVCVRPTRTSDTSEMQELYEANRDIIDNPDLIHPGQELKIPV